MKTISQPRQAASSVAFVVGRQLRDPRAASTPVRPGMRMSRKTRSGWCSSVSSTASSAVLRLGDDLELGPDLGQARAQLLAHQALVVGDQRAAGRGFGCVHRSRMRAVRPTRSRRRDGPRGEPPDQPADEQHRRGDAAAARADDREHARRRCRAATSQRPRWRQQRRRRRIAADAAPRARRAATASAARRQPLRRRQRAPGLAVD